MAREGGQLPVEPDRATPAVTPQRSPLFRHLHTARFGWKALQSSVDPQQ